MNATELTELLKSIEWLNTSALEAACRLPDGTIAKAIKGSRALPEKHVSAIVNELRKLKV